MIEPARVLVVEDRRTWRESLIRLLKTAGYTVDSAPSYSEALGRLRRSSYALVVADLGLRTGTGLLGGIALLEDAAAWGSPTVVVTGRATTERTRVLYNLYKVEWVFEKQNFDPRGFIEIVNEVLGKSPPVKNKTVNPVPMTLEATAPPDWDREVGSAVYAIPEGVHRDIVRGLGRARIDVAFLGIPDYLDKLWVLLSNPQADVGRVYATVLWREIWSQDTGLPPFDMIQLLNEIRSSGNLYKGYRDHLVHSILVYLIGLHLYYANRRIHEALDRVLGADGFLCAWRVAALFHDIGYSLYPKEGDATSKMQRVLMGRLRTFVEGPLQAYGVAHHSYRLVEADEDNIRSSAGSLPVWEPKSFASLRQPMGLVHGHILDGLDDLVLPANLADHGKARYCYRYDEYAKDTDHDKHSRCDDHGMVSAMVLLGQYTYFRRYVEATCRADVLDRVVGLSGAARTELPLLPERVSSCAESVRQAAAAIALHNVHVTGWEKYDSGWARARSEPHYLTLDQYKLTLDGTPLPWLLALADVLQGWDRPTLTLAPASLADCSLNNQQISIKALTPDKLKVALRFEDDGQDSAGSKLEKAIKQMSKYMSDLDLLEI
jgi:CheY-like chemotaxis protein